MNTLEFIELLKEADPKGEATVVVGSYPVIGCDVDPGYWDGHYWKCMKNGEDCKPNEYPDKMRLTGNGFKLRVYSRDVDMFICDNIYHGSRCKKLEDIIEFDSAYSDKKQRDEQKESWMKELNETYNDALDNQKMFLEKWLPKTKKLFEEGRVVSYKSKDHGFWICYLEKDSKRDCLMNGYVMALNQSGEFEYDENAQKDERVWKIKQ